MCRDHDVIILQITQTKIKHCKYSYHFTTVAFITSPTLNRSFTSTNSRTVIQIYLKWFCLNYRDILDLLEILNTSHSTYFKGKKCSVALFKVAFHISINIKIILNKKCTCMLVSIEIIPERPLNVSISYTFRNSPLQFGSLSY